MVYPGSRSTGRLVNPMIFGGLPTLPSVVYPDSPGSYPGSGRDTETCEECRARQDPNVMYLMDPCDDKCRGGFKFPDLPRPVSYTHLTLPTIYSV